MLDPSEGEQFSRQPSLLENRVLALPETISTIIIDEIQKVPKLLNVVHILIESRKLIFILTGSSSRKLKRGASNLLAGRAFVQTMYPFTSLELGERFDLLDALHWGTLPAISNLDSETRKKNFLRSYALTYIKEEIQEEQIVRKLDPFRQFLEVAAQSNGRIIKSTDFVTDRDVKTLNRFAPDFPGGNAFCFSREKKRKKIENVVCLHWQEGLRELGFQFGNDC